MIVYKIGDDIGELKIHYASLYSIKMVLHDMYVNFSVIDSMMNTKSLVRQESYWWYLIRKEYSKDIKEKFNFFPREKLNL